METRNARFWRAFEKKAKIWMENSSDEPSFVMLYLPKPNKSRPVPQIKFFGSSNMKKFVEDVVVRRKFVENCEKPIEVEEPKKLKGDFDSFCRSIMNNVDVGKTRINCNVPVFHPREPDTYTMDDLRILASCLVREEVSFKHGVNRDFLGNSIYRPEWWPDNVKFQSPHERRKGCSLSHADLGKIIDAYRGYRHLITTDDHQQQQNCDDSRAYDQRQTQQQNGDDSRAYDQRQTQQQNGDDSRAYHQRQTQQQNGDDSRAYDQMQTQQQNDALKKLTQKKRRHNCVQSRPRTMDIKEFLQV